MLLIEIIELLVFKLLFEFLIDLNQWMMDWKVSGGSDMDVYMYQ